MAQVAAAINGIPASVAIGALGSTKQLAGSVVDSSGAAVAGAAATASLSWQWHDDSEKKFKVPIFGVIQPGVEAALGRTRSGRIGIIGTNATIRSKAYSNGILAARPGAKVFARATPLLVPLVEEGWTRHPITEAVLREYLGPLLKENIDTLILGCTHYPLLKTAIRKVAGRGVALVDSAESCARYVRERLEALRLLETRRRRQGTIQPFVTDETERFAEAAERFLGVPTEPPWRVELAPV